MPGWADFLAALKHVADLLRHRWSKDRLLATCFKDPPASACRSDIEGFSAQVYEHRWGTVLHAVAEILPLEKILRFAWSHQAFTFQHGAGAAAAADDDRGVHVHAVDKAITSEYFWRYCNLVDMLGDVLRHAQHWAEACPCHSKPDPAAPPLPPALSSKDWEKAQLKRRQHFAKRFKVPSCPLASRRAPELATGRMEDFLDELLATCLQELQMLLRQLSQGEAATLVQDFQAARAHLLYTLRVKLSHWQQLPHVLC
eukprot:12585102-Alexandrium_andersonii.AAC.1